MTTATTLNGGIDAVVIAAVVRDALGFPTTGDYKVTIDDERLAVTAGQGTTSWTVTRGVDGTSAAIHADGAAVYLYQETYASIDDFLLTVGQDTTDVEFLDNAQRRLAEATHDLDREIGYSALQITGTRIVHGDGTGLLHVHGGIVSLSAIDIRLSTGAAWTALQAQDTGWYLEGDKGDPNPVDGVYYHVRLIDTANYTKFPNVTQGVRLTGVFGGNAESRREACVAWARQRMALDPSQMGGVSSGPEDLGGGVSIDRWPRAVYDLIAAERRRFWCHV